MMTTNEIEHMIDIASLFDSDDSLYLTREDFITFINETQKNLTKQFKYAVIKENGTFAGIPCLTYEEASVLSAEHENSIIMKLVPKGE